MSGALHFIQTLFMSLTAKILLASCFSLVQDVTFVVATPSELMT